VLLLAWFLGVSVPLTYLMAAHWFPLPGAMPVSARAGVGGMAIVETTSPEGPTAGLPETAAAIPGWRTVHVLAADCGCSAQVAAYLARRGRLAGCEEEAWVVGMDPAIESLLRRERFPVRNVTEDEVNRLHGIQGGPWLLILRPDGTAAYSGGHADRRPRHDGDMRDLEIWQRLRAGGIVEPLPAFGCATASRLRRELDPLGLKYPGRRVP
jgi:hypothetical protein